MKKKKKSKNKSKEAILSWIGLIDDGKLNGIIRDMQKALNKNKNSTFKMYLQSYGGNIQTSLAFYDWIILNKIESTVVGLSLVSSAATIVFLAGSKRQCTSKTNFLFHRLRMMTEKGSMGPYEIEENLKLISIEKERYNEIYKKLGFSEQELSKIEREGIILTAEEAKERGIIDEIIEI